MNLPLTISLLASSRIATLERCLDSLKPLLLKVPAELIVVFTGTDERVRQVAERYTDHIISFTWCDDFSAVRNAGLKEAKGEWFLYLDDDEWFDDVEEICEFFQSGDYQRYRSATYIQHNYLDWNGISYMDYAAFRMAKRDKGLKFENPIHEELAPIYQPTKHFKAYVHHYGYLKDVEKKSAGKGQRNIPLLLKDIEERPDYVKNYLQLTQEYCTEKKWKEAEKACREGRKHCPETEFQFESWLQYNLVYVIYKMKDYERAEQEGEEILKKERPSEVARVNLLILMVGLCVENHKLEKALEYGIAFEELFDYLEKHPRLWEKQEYADLNRDRVVTPSLLYPTRLNCVNAAMSCQNYEKALFFLKLLPWEEEHMIQLYYSKMDVWKEIYAPHMQRLLAELPYESPYLLYQKLLFEETGENGEKKQDVFLFRRCLKEIDQPYLQRQLVEKAIWELRDFSPLLNRMDLDYWKACITAIVNDTTFTESPKLWEARRTLFANHPLQGWYLEKLLLEKELTRGFQMKDEMKASLEQYARCIADYYQEQYQESMFTKELRYLLPADCRMALVVLEALEYWERGQLVETVRLFRSALKIHPQMTGVVLEMLRHLKNEIEQPAMAVGGEFEQLAVQMKMVLRTMIESGQYQEAEGVLDQLLPLLPGDMELLKLQQMLLTRI